MRRLLRSRSNITQYESIIDPEETWLEKWLMHEAAEIYNYYSCLTYETDNRVKEIWQRFLDYELGHFHYVWSYSKNTKSAILRRLFHLRYRNRLNTRATENSSARF